MSNFIREPWILSSLLTQIHKHALPSLSFQCQLIEIVCENDTLEVIVSDCHHSITAILGAESVSNFRRIYAQDWVEIKGCFLSLDVFAFDYSFERNVFFANVAEFSYFGSECEIIGDPMSVNGAKGVREILSHEICKRLHFSELCAATEFLKTEGRKEILDIVVCDREDNVAPKFSVTVHSKRELSSVTSVQKVVSEDILGDILSKDAKNGAMEQPEAMLDLQKHCENNRVGSDCVDVPQMLQVGVEEVAQPPPSTPQNVGHKTEVDEKHTEVEAAPQCPITTQCAVGIVDSAECAAEQQGACAARGVIIFQDKKQRTGFDLSIFSKKRKTGTNTE